ncbi:hypothetical protein HN51_028420 [Arachis hypogaea]|nr:Bowman-Birk type proteinase inhibitor B-II [Arachis duranensis]XP_025619419.1 Bowman-Birk type proteinase inhibitor B-II-like [Arachis hypogaea]QHO34907.1 Bowman-Birk type proteinase inhibitor B-II [Arachis hypogaea]
MENQKMVVKVALLLFLVGLSATVEAVRLDPSLIISQVINNIGEPSAVSAASDCCSACICDRRAPPYFECTCGDTFDHCPAACNKCVCTRSIPPQCRCTDRTQGRCPLTPCA